MAHAEPHEGAGLQRCPPGLSEALLEDPGQAGQAVGGQHTGFLGASIGWTPGAAAAAARRSTAAQGPTIRVPLK